MERKIRLLIIAVAMMATLTTNAQVKVGVKGGIDVTEMSFKNDVFNADNRLGWFIGPTLKIGMPLVGFSVDVSALYNQREATIDVYYSPEGSSYAEPLNALKTKQVLVPVNARLGMGLGDVANVFVFAGPQVAFCLGDESQNLTDYKEDAAEWQLSSSNFSVNLGGGFTIGHLQFTANYNIGIGKTGDVTWQETAEEMTKNKGSYKGWQIAATYFF